MLADILGGTKIANPKELLVRDLGAALTMENAVGGMLEQLIDVANGADLKQQLRHHLEETHAQIRNLNQIFEALGGDPKEQPCPAIEGIEKGVQATLNATADDLHDAVILAGCAETEHHEIAVYENLIVHTGALNHDDIVGLLQANLDQEQHMLTAVQTLAHTSAQRP